MNDVKEEDLQNLLGNILGDLSFYLLFKIVKSQMKIKIWTNLPIQYYKIS